MRALLRVKHDEAIRSRQVVHLGDFGELLGVLFAAVQHHHQRRRTRGVQPRRNKQPIGRIAVAVVLEDLGDARSR